MFFVKDFVKAELGEKFIESPPFDLKAAFQDSSNTTPIIFVLSPGADPIPYLMNLAKEVSMDGERLRIISLGQGQGPIASKLIDMGQQNGDWVCLQNCHLSASWMPELEKIQEKQDEHQTHPEYRLWLTSMPSDHFPVPVLQSGIKITNEPPKGLKANLKRTFQEVKEQDYESCTKPREYKKLLFALGYFHAVILERRKFGAIGWNIPYSWMQSDFMISKAQVKMFLDEQPDVPYVALNYLVAETNYGGRVTDDKDVRLIKALLKRYFCADILRDDYKLSNLDTYYAPAEGSLDQSKDYINSLPLDDDPEIFGLHPNANITFQQKTVKEFHDTIISIQPRVAGGGSALTPEEIVEKIAQEYEAKLPEILKVKKAHSDTFQRDERGDMVSLGVFVGQEIDRFNILLVVIQKSLINLQKAIKGTVVMSAELERMFNNFLDKKVPVIWEKVAYPSLKPLGSWFQDLILRLKFMSDWLYNGPPKTFWLPAFFFPQGFMTASLQSHARLHQIPIDTLQFKTHIRDVFCDGIEELPETGVNIHGLFMQGAKWSSVDVKIRDSEAGKLFVEMPVIWLEPVFDNVKLDDKAYDCPLYKTSLR